MGFAVDEGGGAGGIERFGEEVALGEFAVEGFKLLGVLGGLDSFGGDANAKRMGQGDNGLDDLKVLAVEPHAVDERTVDLEQVDGKAMEVAERRIAGAEVVDTELNAQFLQALQMPD